jgi:hypothetical protein
VRSMALPGGITSLVAAVPRGRRGSRPGSRGSSDDADPAQDAILSASEATATPGLPDRSLYHFKRLLGVFEALLRRYFPKTLSVYIRLSSHHPKGEVTVIVSVAHLPLTRGLDDLPVGLLNHPCCSWFKRPILPGGSLNLLGSLEQRGRFSPHEVSRRCTIHPQV